MMKRGMLAVCLAILIGAGCGIVAAQWMMAQAAEPAVAEAEPEDALTEQVEEIVAAMTPEEKIGQMMMAGLVPATEGEHSFSADELEYVFSHASHAHPADALVNKLMVQSLRVRSTTAHQIMIPKEEVVVLWLDRPLKDNLRVAQVSGLSRFPVCRGNKDTVEGMLLMREWLWQIAALGPDMPFEPLIRPLLTFDLKTTVPTMIERFRAERSHLAVVRNETGGMAGIVQVG